MTTEILTLANSIAASKESIRQSLVARGVSCDTSVPLADYADKIDNMVVSGSADNILVKNYSGAAINTGDRVFIKKNKDSQELSYTNLYSGSNSTTSLISPDGNVAFYAWGDYINNKFLDWGATSIQSSSYTSSRAEYMNSIKYDDFGQMWQFNYNVSMGYLYYPTLGYHLSSKYTLKTGNNAFDGGASSGSAAYIYEYDSTNSIVKTFNFTLPVTTYGRYVYGIATGGYIFTTFDSNYTYYAQIPANDGDSITFTSTGVSSRFPIGVTSDGKYLICVNNYQPSSGCYIKFRDITSNPETMGTSKTFTNPELTIFANNVGVYASFNPANQVLCLMRNTKTNTMSDIGLFKYNPTTEDWDTITPDLTAYYAAGNVFSSSYDAGCITISNDLSRMAYGRNVFNLPYTSSGGYVAVSGLRSPTETNFVTAGALEDCSAAAGSTFNAKVVLPELISVSITVDDDNAELSVE